MKKALFVLIVSFFAMMQLASDEAQPDASGMMTDTGYVYKYEVWGTQKYPDIVYVYCPQPYVMERLRIEEELDYPTLEREVFNRELLMAESCEWQYMGSMENIKENNTYRLKITTDFAKRSLRSVEERKTPEGLKSSQSRVVRFNKFPTYFYTEDDGIGLIGALPSLFDKGQKSVEVGILAGSFYVDANVRFVGEESVSVPYGTVACLKYEVEGKGLLAALFGKKAWIWLSKNKPYYMVKYHNDTKREIGFDFLEYRLVYRKPLSAEEWEAAKEEFKQKGSKIVPEVLL